MSPSFSSMSPEKFAAFVETQVDALRAETTVNPAAQPAAPAISPDPPAESSRSAASSESSVQPENPASVPSAEKRSKRSRPGRHKPKKPARRIYYPGIAQFTFERHRRLCQICQHPHRHIIESDFLDWRDPNHIYKEYKVDYSALYRHARATGLLQQRQQNVSVVVHKILEYVDGVEMPSTLEILRAVRTLACLNNRGQWTKAPTTHIVATAGAQDRVHQPASIDLPGAVESSPALPSIEPPDSSFKGQFQYSNRNSS